MTLSIVSIVWGFFQDIMANNSMEGISHLELGFLFGNSRLLVGALPPVLGNSS